MLYVVTLLSVRGLSPQPPRTMAARVGPSQREVVPSFSTVGTLATSILAAISVVFAVSFRAERTPNSFACISRAAAGGHARRLVLACDRGA